MTNNVLSWGAPYTKDQLDDAQAKWQLRFPPDLVNLFLERRPVCGRGHMVDWVADSDDRIREALDWPLRGFWFDVERAGVWWAEWGERPTDQEARYDALKSAFAEAPTLIPIFAHRYLPAEPNEDGNPVFSVWQTDVIYYGADLMDYFDREFSDSDDKPWPETIKRIPFWTLAVERNG